MSNIVTFKNEVPVTSNRITVVTRYDNAGVLIRDYEKGKPVNKGEVANISNSNIVLHKYPFANDIYVEETLKAKFMYMFGTYTENQMELAIATKDLEEAIESVFKDHQDLFWLNDR